MTMMFSTYVSGFTVKKFHSANLYGLCK